MSTFKPALQVQSKKPTAKSVSSNLPDAVQDANESRYWSEKFGLGQAQSSVNARKYAHPRAARLAAGTAAIVQQVHFGPSYSKKHTVLAVACGPRVLLYGTTPQSEIHRLLLQHERPNGAVEAVVSKPDRQVPTGGHLALTTTIRQDGRLLAIGTDNGQVRVADTTSRVTVATFTVGNRLSIRSVEWLRNGQLMVSAGDDGVLRVWQLQQAAMGGASSSGSQEALITCPGHGDSIRSTALWQESLKDASKWPSRSLVATGSYDHTVRLWNLDNLEGSANSNSSSKNSGGNRCLSVLGHGAPVEVVVWMESKDPEVPAWLLSAGGTIVKVWNPLSGVCVCSLDARHRKTITCLLGLPRVDPVAGARMRVLTSGIDGLIRVHSWDAETGQLVHLAGIPLNVPITSLAAREGSDRIAIGTAEGNVLVRQKGASITAKKRTLDAPAGTYSFFTRGKNADVAAGDYVVESTSGKKRKLRKFDISLKQFRYGDALDEALETRMPSVVVAVLEELGKRRGLQIALSNRDEEGLEPILSFTVRYVSRPRFASLLVGVSHKLIDIYGGVAGQSEIIDELFEKLKLQVASECRIQKSLYKVVGQLDAIMTVLEMSEGI